MQQSKSFHVSALSAIIAAIWAIVLGLTPIAHGAVAPPTMNIVIKEPAKPNPAFRQQAISAKLQVRFLDSKGKEENLPSGTGINWMVTRVTRTVGSAITTVGGATCTADPADKRIGNLTSGGFSDVGLYKMFVTATITNSAWTGSTFNWAIIVPVMVTRARLQQVSFSGSAYHDVVQDDGVTCSAPQWVDMNDNGVATDAGDFKQPICFERHNKIQAAVEIKMAPNSTGAFGGVRKIRGKTTIAGDGGTIEFPATNAASGGDILSATIISNVPLLNQVDRHKPLHIDWQASGDNGVTWFDAGASENVLYVTQDAPVGGVTLFETVLDIGCRNGKNAGINSDAQAVNDAIWVDFAGPIPGVKNVKDEEMKYWPLGYGSPYNFDTQPLILQKSGRCGAWSKLHRDTVRAQGINADKYKIAPKPSSIPSSAPPTHPTFVAGFVGFVVGASAAQGNKQAKVTEISVNPGPGGGPKSGLPDRFNDHATVKVVGASGVYDPSYGTHPASQQSWEDGSLTKFYALCVNSAGSHAYVYKLDPSGGLPMVDWSVNN